jgi:hypothetical protein
VKPWAGRPSRCIVSVLVADKAGGFSNLSISTCLRSQRGKNHKLAFFALHLYISRFLSAISHRLESRRLSERLELVVAEKLDGLLEPGDDGRVEGLREKEGRNRGRLVYELGDQERGNVERKWWKAGRRGEAYLPVGVGEAVAKKEWRRKKEGMRTNG